MSNPISHRILFFLILSQSYSQQISVQDETTNEILPDVVVYNEDKSKSIITNTNGIVDLDIFSGDEKIYFQLLGYSLLERIKDSLVNGDIIYLQSSVSTEPGRIYHMQGNGSVALAASSSASTGSLFVALGDNATKGLLMRGNVKLEHDSEATLGQPIFLDHEGKTRSTSPSNSGAVVRSVGFYLSGSGTVMFNPDNTSITLA